MVDNGSIDDVVERVGMEMPVGPGHRADGQHRVRPWLQHRHARPPATTISGPREQRRHGRSRLAAAARRSGGRRHCFGAACPKILFDGRFVEVEVTVHDAAPDRRRSADARRAGDRCPHRRRACRRPAGLRRRVLPARGTGPQARRGDGSLVVATRDASGCAWTATTSRRRSRCAWRRSSPRTATVRTARTGGSTSASTGPGLGRRQLDGMPIDVINNVGSALYPARLRRRSWLPGGRPRPVRRAAAEVFAWCGGAVLMRRGVPRRRRAVRRAAVPLLRGHRSVVARAAARVALPVRPDIGRAPSPRPVVSGVGSPVFRLLHPAQPSARAVEERAGPRGLRAGHRTG